LLLILKALRINRCANLDDFSLLFAKLRRLVMKPVEIDRFFTRCPCCGESFRTDRAGDRYCHACVRWCDVRCRVGDAHHYGGYVLAEGEGKPIAIYSRCEDPLLARAELLLTMDEAREGRLRGEAMIRRAAGHEASSLNLRRAPIWGFYDVDQTFGIEEFLDAYREGDKLARLLGKLAWLRANGWKFNHAPSKETHMARHVSDIVEQAEDILKAYAAGRKKAAVYVRKIPESLPEVRDVYFEDKWRGLDERLGHPDIEAIYVMYPDVLGDSHVELLVNLSKIARRGVTLGMVKPSPFLKEFGELGNERGAD